MCSCNDDAIERKGPSASHHSQLELTVRNHPGVMSHICGLFSRRGFNLEGILCMPTGDGTQSRIWLLVSEDGRIEQIMKQIVKLEDVLDIRRGGADAVVFRQIEEFFGTGGPKQPQRTEVGS